MAVKGQRVAFFNDFTGGLNIDAPRQSLTMNETFDCLDVDFNLRGGFTQRRGLKVINPSAGGSVTARMNGGYLLGQVSFGTDMVVGVSDQKQLFLWDGSTATHVATAVTDQTDTVRQATWTAKMYLANCWSGGSLTTNARSGAGLATVTVLTNTFNDNYTAPTGGNIPKSRIVCNHAGFLWVADTVESGTRHRTRVRWSHPLQPEDWATADYFDIEPDDQTDEITALVPFKDVLLVFKKRSVWGIYGYDKDSFVAERISAASGAWTQEAVAVNAGIAYWWSPDGNVYAFNGQGVVPVGTRIRAVLRDGLIDAGNNHRLCWAEERLYVSLVKSDGVSRFCFVYDPRVGRSGAWTKYSFEPTSFCWWRGVAGDNKVLMTLRGKDGLFDHNNPNQVQDEFVVNTLSEIPAYYSTAWFSGNDTALSKQFKRLHLTAATQDPCTFNVEVYHDFNDSVIHRTLLYTVATPGGGMLWGTSVWGGAAWGSGDALYSFARLPSAGRGHSIRMVFKATDNTSSWWVDSFTLPYVEKSYR
jgi:hypothetical protein